MPTPTCPCPETIQCPELFLILARPSPICPPLGSTFSFSLQAGDPNLGQEAECTRLPTKLGARDQIHFQGTRSFEPGWCSASIEAGGRPLVHHHPPRCLQV